MFCFASQRKSQGQQSLRKYKVVSSHFPPVVTEVGHYVVHDINQQWDHPLLLVTVEHHVQQMSQHLMNKFSICSCPSYTICFQ